MIVKSFLKSESGAITVDWTVVTAATVGLGLASAAAVQTGTSSLGESISASLSNAAAAVMGIVNGPGMMGFEDGNFEGWNLSTTGYSDALGHFLGPFAGSDGPALHDVVLPDGATSATISFDLLLLDSWDGTSMVHSDARYGGRGDGIAFTVDGIEVGYSAMTNGGALSPTGTIDINGTTYSYEIARQDGGQLYGVDGHWNDARYSVNLSVENPPPGGFQLGINGTSNQVRSDESFGIDNYIVTATTD